MSGYVLALDQGTTGSTAMVVSPQSQVLGRGYREFSQHYPKSGWVEHDPEEIWTSIVAAAEEAMNHAGVERNACVALGIANQRETTVLWERKTHRPIRPAIVWQDRRTAERCQAMKRNGLEANFRERTGLVLDPYFSGTKIEWMLDETQGLRSRAERGDIAFGTIDSFLIHRLTSGAVHATDRTNASRTLLFNIHACDWDSELAGELRVPLAMLPEVRPSSGVFGYTKGFSPLPDGVPIAGVAGDQQSALFGQACWEEGMAKCTYGTGAFLLMNTGSTPVPSHRGLLTTIACEVAGRVSYAIEGSAFIAGAAVQWLRDGLGLISESPEVEKLAASVESSSDVVFVPALTGLGAPYWDPDARGLICGITRDTSRGHLARAALEGIALQICDLVQAMESDSGRSLKRFRVDGGAAQNGLLMQTQANLLGVPVDRPLQLDTTALGAAFLAGLGVGFYEDMQAILRRHVVAETFHGEFSEPERITAMQRWHSAVRRARSELS
ncbi:MAG: glycerol kinase GlpK [Myxococcota bacterium]